MLCVTSHKQVAERLVVCLDFWFSFCVFIHHIRRRIGKYQLVELNHYYF